MLQSLLPGSAEAALATAAGWLLTYLAASTLVLAAAWLLDGRTPLTRSPAARADLWTAAVLAPVLAVLLQALTGVGPRLEVAVSEAEKVVAEFGPPPAAAAGGRANPASPSRVEPASRGPVGIRAAAGRGSPGGPGATLHRPHRAERADPAAWGRSLGHDWPFLLALLWIGAGGLLVLLQLLGWVRFAWRLRGRTAVEAGTLRADLGELVRAARHPRPVRLSRSPAVVSPVALPGGEICLPAQAARALDREQARAVLAHELVHVRRGDSARLLLLRLLERALFLQPLNRLARRRVEAVSEDLSDAWVHGRGMGPTLAGALVTVARWIRTERDRTDLAGLTSTSAMERRVRRLLEPEGGSDPGIPTTRWSAPALALVGALLVVVPGVDVGTIAHPPVAHSSAERGARMHAGADVAPGSPRLPAGRAVATDPEGVSRLAGVLADRSTHLRVRLRQLLARDGGTLAVRLQGADGRVSVALRPGGTRVRLVGPDGRTALLEPRDAPDDGAWVAALRVPEASAGRWELHLPRSVRRLSLEVDGRRPPSGGPSAGGEIPRMVELR